MKNSTIALCAFLMGSVVQAAPPEPSLIQKLTSVITNLCPKAEIKVDDYAFSAKYDTMVYTIHSRSRSGEVYPKTFQEESPGFRGFMLRVSLHDGEYVGAARVPQTLQGPHFPTFIDALSTDQGKKYYQVHFSYCGRPDRELKKAILEAIPRTRATQNRTGTSGIPAAARLAEYRNLLKEGLAPLEVLKGGMTSGEVQKLFPNAKSGMDGGAPILTFATASGRRIVIYFHKATDRMNLANVYLHVRGGRWFDSDRSAVPAPVVEDLKAGIEARWSREDVVRRMGLPDHMSAALNDRWQYGMYTLRFREDVLQAVSPPPRPHPLPGRVGR